MDKLEKLTQDESGILHRADGRELHPQCAVPKGKITTIVESNPCDIDGVIAGMAERDSVVIPKGANAYVASDWNPDTQHLRKSNLEGDGKFYSVFAVQFYYASNFSY